MTFNKIEMRTIAEYSIILLLITACAEPKINTTYECVTKESVYEIVRQVDFLDHKALDSSYHSFFVKTTFWENKENIVNVFRRCPDLKEVLIVIDDVNAEPTYDRFGNEVNKTSKIFCRMTKPSIDMLQMYQSLDAFYGDNENFTFRKQLIAKGKYRGERVVELVINPIK